jgi:hypothetical protein
VFLILMSMLLALLLLHSPLQALLGTAVVLAGVPVYGAFQRKLVARSEYESLVRRLQKEV